MLSNVIYHIHGDENELYWSSSNSHFLKKKFAT